ncbi:MAG: ferrous iron transport protein A [Synergistaceae bacterium]|jgi:Fe2+ transport system protein FeoA|nr:ferrous iron transport protein A [Synergistaceae bacterium]
MRIMPTGETREKMLNGTKTLREFALGEAGKVVSISATGPVRRRLFDMGITPGADIVLRRVAPLGDPIEITIRGYQLSIRGAEAGMIAMRPDSGTDGEGDRA